MKENKEQSLFRRIFKWTFRTIGIIILIFLVWSLIPLKETVKPLHPRKDTQYWALKDGYKIAYTKIEGDSANANPVIIFLHGGPGGYIHSAIINQMKDVAQYGYDVYLYDQIGSGLSDRLPKPKDYSFNRHLENLNEIIESHIKSPKVILIGHSYGGILATHFTANNPELVSKLILSSPGDLQPYRQNIDGTMAIMDELYPVPKNLEL